jgi:hypothetical protein
VGCKKHVVCVLRALYEDCSICEVIFWVG